MAKQVRLDLGQNLLQVNIYLNPRQHCVQVQVHLSYRLGEFGLGGLGGLRSSPRLQIPPL